jgi:hypothetical protein
MVKATIIGSFAIAALLTIAACEGIAPSASSNQATTQSAPVSTGGRVVYRETSGGFFGILADDGRQYEPSNLDVAFHVEGLRVKITGQRDTTSLGKHAWGNPVELASVTVSGSTGVTASAN